MFVLEQEYQRDANWDTEKIAEIADRLGLNRTKVYKWSWDRRKKDTLGLPVRGLAKYEASKHAL